MTELFDEVLHLEEQYQQEGRAAGIAYDGCPRAGCSVDPARYSDRAGRDRGLREGRLLGVYKVPGVGVAGKRCTPSSSKSGL